MVSSLALPNANMTFPYQSVFFSRDTEDSAYRGDDMDSKESVGVNNPTDAVDPADA